MANGTAGDFVFAGAQLSLTPSSIILPSTYPWGGTALAPCKNVVVKAGRKWKAISEEAFGPMPLTGIDLGETWSVAGTFRTYDEDVIQKVFLSTITGASTGKVTVAYPNGNTYRTGGLMSNRGQKILITPDDIENNRFFYIYNGVFMYDENESMPFQRDEEWILPFRILCLPDANNKTVAFGMREDLNSIL